jgi:HEAT repeat protein
MSKPLSFDAMLSDLRSPDATRRIDALLRLKNDPPRLTGENTLEALIENLCFPGKSVQRHAADALAVAAARNPAVVARLTAMLDAPQPRARWVAAYALGRIEGALDLRACAALLDAFADDDGDVRWAALELLVRLGRRYRDAIRERLLMAQQNAAVNRRKMSIYALRDLAIFDGAAVSAVCAACAGADTQVTLAALSFLKEAGADGRAVVDAVVACLESSRDPGVRRAAAFTLGYLGDHSQRVLSALDEAANTADDASLSKTARRSLDRLKEER